MNEFQESAHQISKDHGFWEGRDGDSIPAKIALIHSELSEALEAYRDDDMKTWYKFDEGEGIFGKPEGFGVELADAIIRIFDLAEFCGYSMEDLVREKMAYNVNRPHRHGGKAI